ncbi:MAG: hypothetical protein ACQER9_00215 [Nanobdellota archaeon]
MRGIVFDSGPIISLTMSGSQWLLEALKKNFNGEFIIPKSVSKEIIDRPMKTKKYKFESIRIMPYIANGILKIVDEKDDEDISKKANEILDIANKCFFNKGNAVKIVHYAEAEAIATCIKYDIKTLVIDERNTRYLIEAPLKIKKRLERKLHTKIDVKTEMIENLKKKVGFIRAIRSCELATIAYEKGLLDFYKLSNFQKRKDFDKGILEGILWALKLNGCAIVDKEINAILEIEK